MQVFVKYFHEASLKNLTTVMCVDESMTLYQLKYAIKQLLNIPVNKQRIRFSGLILTDNNKKLLDYGVAKENTLFLGTNPRYIRDLEDTDLFQFKTLTMACPKCNLNNCEEICIPCKHKFCSDCVRMEYLWCGNREEEDNHKQESCRMCTYHPLNKCPLCNNQFTNLQKIKIKI